MAVAMTTMAKIAAAGRLCCPVDEEYRSVASVLLTMTVE